MKTERPETLNELKDFHFSVKKQNQKKTVVSMPHASASTTIFHLWDRIKKSDLNKGSTLTKVWEGDLRVVGLNPTVIEP